MISVVTQFFPFLTWVNTALNLCLDVLRLIHSRLLEKCKCDGINYICLRILSVWSPENIRCGQLFHCCFFSHMHAHIIVIYQPRSLSLCVFFSHPVLSIAEEALLSDCQDLPNPNQAVLLSSTWQHHQGHARLQEGGACHRSGQTLPQSRTRTRLQWWYEAWLLTLTKWIFFYFLPPKYAIISRLWRLRNMLRMQNSFIITLVWF